MLLKQLLSRSVAVRLAVALFLSSIGVMAHSAPQISLTNDTFSITGSGASAGFSQSAVVSADGTVSTIANVPSTNGVGIPSFSFGLTSASTATAGTYNFRVGVIIEDKNSTNQNRRMEAEIGTLTLNVPGGGGSLSGSIPGTQALKVVGSDSANTTQISVTNATNTAANGPISISNGTVSFNGANLLTRIRNANTLFDTILLPEFNQPATYNYWIVVKQTSGSAVEFGTGSFTKFTSQPTVAGPSFIRLLTPADYVGAYFVKGEFNVVFSSGSSGGGGSTTVTQGTSNLNSEVDSIPAITPGSTPSADVIAKVDTAVSNAADLAAQGSASAAAGTLSANDAVSLLTAVNKTVAVASQAKQAGSTTSTTTAVSALTNIASIFDGLSKNPSAVSPAQRTLLATEAQKAIDNAKGLIKTGGTGATTQGELIALVDAGAKLLEKVTQLNNNEVPGDVITAVKGLSTSAIKNSIQGELAGSNINPEDPVAVRNFLQTNAGALSKAVDQTITFKLTTTLSGIEGTTCDDSKAEQARILAATAMRAGLNFNIPVEDSCPSAISSALMAGGNLFAVTETPDIAIDDTGRLVYSTSTEKYIGSTLLRFVPESIPEGVHNLPNGKTMIVKFGLATEIAPTAFDATSFNAAVSGAGFTLSYKDNGSIAIALGNNETFSGAFAYDNLGTATSCGVTTFTAPTGNPTDAGYAFIANCTEGATQRITPFANTDAFYTTLANAGISASTDRNTGIVTIPTVGSFKPSFFVTQRTLNDTAFYDANKNAEGIAFRATDANGDGKTDYAMISATGVQVMYAL